MAGSIRGESVLATSAPDATLIRAGANPDAISLTIGIPTYRRPSLVVRAIRSAIASSEAFVGSVELIVSDNSPEVTSDICQSELLQWPGRAVYLANRPTIGMVPNLNQCIARAQGRYVLLVHDDDYLLPGATGAVLAETEAAANSAAVLLFGVRVVDVEGRVRRQQVFTREQYLSPAQAMVRVLSDPSFIRAPGIVIRRDVFSTLGMFDHTLGNPNDFEMWLRIASRFGVRCLPATISAYSVHEAAATTRTFTVETVRTNLEIFDRAAALPVVSEPLVRMCEADWFCQFFLAGVSRRLGAEDRDGARAIMALFDLPEIRALRFSPACRLARTAADVLVAMPPLLSRAIARRLQYRGAWSRWLQRVDSMRPMPEAERSGSPEPIGTGPAPSWAPKDS